MMPSILPEAIERILAKFFVLFSQRVWWHVEVLVIGTILGQGRRTVRDSQSKSHKPYSQSHRYRRENSLSRSISGKVPPIA